jgi:hypothetical protein
MMGWSTRRLAGLGGFSPNTISNLEHGHDGLDPKTINRAVTIYSAAGLEFTDRDGWVGVRCRKSSLEAVTGHKQA